MESLYSERKEIKQNMLHKKQKMVDVIDENNKKDLKRTIVDLNTKQMSLKKLSNILYGNFVYGSKNSII
jgi:hypothetical protein